MAKKLYIGNLPFSANDSSLKSLFEQAGPVASATVIIDKMSGRSRGFGFVEMENDDDAQKAIDTLNGKDFDGRSIVVNEARPLGERPPRRGGFHRGGFGGGRGRDNDWQ